MILELVNIDVKQGQNEAFELDLKFAITFISQAKGFKSIEAKKCIEIGNRFILLIYWETLEDHVVTFRQSDLFVQWRKCIGSYFDSMPLVHHFNSISTK